MFNFMTKNSAYNDTLIALAPAVVSLSLVYCWILSVCVTTASSGLSII